MTTELQKHAGANAAISALPGLTMGTSGRLSTAMAEISKAEPERALALLDGVKSALRGAANVWSEVYECGLFFEQNPDYWKAAGFDNFDEFWRDIAGGIFGKLNDLEMMYNLAKTACPELFNMDFASAVALRTNLVEMVPTPGPHGGSNQYTIKKTISNEFADEDEAKAMIVMAANMPVGGTTAHVTRIGKLARDKPEIYQRMLRGDYFKSSPVTGLVSLDVVKAEKEAGIGPGSKPKPTDDDIIRSLRDRVRGMMTKAGKSATQRAAIINELRQCSWIMKGLTDGR